MWLWRPHQNLTAKAMGKADRARRADGIEPAVGCGEAKKAPPKTMRISDVPAAFMETARKELPNVDFDEVWVKKDGTLEIRGKAKNGKVREIKIRPDGTVEEIE